MEVDSGGMVLNTDDSDAPRKFALRAKNTEKEAFNMSCQGVPPSKCGAAGVRALPDWERKIDMNNVDRKI